MGKKLNDTLQYLGSEYSVKSIDLEPCIYRKYGKYELEISGLLSRGRYDASIYVWDDKKRIVKTVHGARSKEELSKHLETLLAELSHNLD